MNRIHRNLLRHDTLTFSFVEVNSEDRKKQKRASGIGFNRHVDRVRKTRSKLRKKKNLNYRDLD